MFKVGDRVTSELFGEGTVTSIDTHDLDQYPIDVAFDSNTLSRSFTVDGIFNKISDNPSANIKLIEKDAIFLDPYQFSVRLDSDFWKKQSRDTEPYPDDSYWFDKDLCKKRPIAVESQTGSSLVKFPQLYRQCIADRILAISDDEIPKLWKIYMSEDLSLKEFSNSIIEFVVEIEKLNEELNRLNKE